MTNMHLLGKISEKTYKIQRFQKNFNGRMSSGP
jgi:hypothetical protein